MLTLSILMLENWNKVAKDFLSLLDTQIFGQTVDRSNQYENRFSLNLTIDIKHFVFCIRMQGCANNVKHNREITSVFIKNVIEGLSTLFHITVFFNNLIDVQA